MDKNISQSEDEISGNQSLTVTLCFVKSSMEALYHAQSEERCARGGKGVVIWGIA